VGIKNVIDAGNRQKPEAILGFQGGESTQIKSPKINLGVSYSHTSIM
jgi:hypothetical protein